jgi:hypothetical protein
LGARRGRTPWRRNGHIYPLPSAAWWGLELRTTRLPRLLAGLAHIRLTWSAVCAVTIWTTSNLTCGFPIGVRIRQQRKRPHSDGNHCTRRTAPEPRRRPAGAAPPTALA